MSRETMGSYLPRVFCQESPPQGCRLRAAVQDLPIPWTDEDLQHTPRLWDAGVLACLWVFLAENKYPSRGRLSFRCLSVRQPKKPGFSWQECGRRWGHSSVLLALLHFKDSKGFQLQLLLPSFFIFYISSLCLGRYEGMVSHVSDYYTRGVQYTIRIKMIYNVECSKGYTTQRMRELLEHNLLAVHESPIMILEMYWFRD